MKVKMNMYDISINGIKIDNKIFDEEMSDYDFREREEVIDSLIDMISECGRDRESDKYLMKEDLKSLIGLSDKYVFSSISTNEYIAQSDNICRFDNICEEILKLNEGLK